MIKFNTEASDIAINNKNNFALNSYEEDVVQRINFKISLDRGDWFLDPQLGIPWSSEIFKTKNKALQEKLITTYVKNEIENDQDFFELVTLKIIINEINRKLIIKWGIISKNGVSYDGIKKIEVNYNGLRSY